ncbi:hypothetical protein BC629DRAFT_1543784 [Irpex lacteus]|nr:hypothetical protein BC629DRAFT_1543784 [Irpex lacteus]
MQSEPLPLVCDRCSTQDPYLKAKSCHWKRGAKCSEAQATQRNGDLAMCPCIGSRSQVRPSSESSSESVATAQHDGHRPGQHNVYSSAKFRPPCPREDSASYIHNVAESAKAAGEEEDLRPYFTPHVLPHSSDYESRPSTDLSASLSAEGYSLHFSSGLMLKSQQETRSPSNKTSLRSRVTHWFKRVLRWL